MAMESGGAAAAPGAQPEDIHVLLVDDEKMSRVVVGNLLRKCRYQVTVATSGLEALDTLRRHEKGTFHIILTDVMMPDVDGIELLRHVRSDEAFNYMPVVMMSANEHTDTVFECIRRGAEDYLLKPVTRKEVQYICQHVWRRQKQGAQTVPLLAGESGQTGLPGGVVADDARECVPSVASALPPQAAAEPADGRPPFRRRGAAAIGGVGAAPAAAARHAAAELLADRVTSGAAAGFSGRPRDAQDSSAPGSGGGSPAAAAADSGTKVPLSVYFAQRRAVVNSAASFRIFCAAVALLQERHARGQAVRVRPSRLCLTPTGALATAPSSARQAEVEDRLYASPEELLNKPLEAASDVYSLGVLFFELFNPVESAKERLHALSGLRHRILPMDLLQGRPQEAAFVLSLLHPDPTARPSAAQLLQPGCLSALQASICRPAAGRGGPRADSVDVATLLDFLRLMHSNKEAEASHIQAHLHIIDRDIQQVSQRLRELLGKGGRGPGASLDYSSDSGGSSHSAPASRGKREREGGGQESRPACSGGGGGGAAGRRSFEVPKTEGGEGEDRLKWSRIWNDFPILENVYLQRREAGQAAARALGGGGGGRGSGGGGGSGSGGECAGEGEGGSAGDAQLSDFSRDLSLLAKRARFEVKAELRYGDLMGEGDMVCSAAFDRDDEFFATAGVSKRIKVFELGSLLEPAAALHYPVLEIAINSKVSSMCWNAYVKGCLLAADYEGALQLWDVSAGAVTAQFEEHSKRVWSVDFSRTDPTRFVSGSDDGTVRLWSMRDAGATATIDTKANVCSVQMSPADSHLMAFGSANYRVYLYDLRKMDAPLAVIGGHRRAVSYVRFLGRDRLVSASTDSSLRLWDLAGAAGGGQPQPQPLMTYTGHTNERNFVGMSVSRDGFIACGSESNEVFAYHHRLPLPLTSHSLALPRRPHAELEGRQFVSTVCWAHRGGCLLAANSAGVIKLLSLAQ